jgi:hypothetical protein
MDQPRTNDIAVEKNLSPTYEEGGGDVSVSTTAVDLVAASTDAGYYEIDVKDEDIYIRHGTAPVAETAGKRIQAGQLRSVYKRAGAALQAITASGTASVNVARL